MFGDADGSNAGSAAAVGDAEGFVEVEMADIRADAAWGGEAELGVEIGSVHVDLTTVLVREAADLGDGFFKHAMGGGVSDHEGSDFLAMALKLGAEVTEVDVALVIAGDGDDLETDHDGAGGVGAVGGGGDKADVTVALIVGEMVTADGEKAGVFALRASIGLERDGVEAGAFGQPGLQLGEELTVALGLCGGGKGVEGIHLRPAQGQHFGGGIQLHGAGAEGDHAAVQGDVFVLEAAEIAHHGRLRVVAVEDRMGEDGGVAMQSGGAGEEGGLVEEGRGVGGGTKGREHAHQFVNGYAFVEGDDDLGGALCAEVDTFL